MRWLATGSSGLSLFGLAMGVLSGRNRWLLLPLVVQGFYLQHTMQGWCPPLPVFRELGFRTPHEIEEERRRLLELASPAREEASGDGDGFRWGKGG